MRNNKVIHLFHALYLGDILHLSDTNICVRYNFIIVIMTYYQLCDNKKGLFFWSEIIIKILNHTSLHVVIKWLHEIVGVDQQGRKAVVVDEAILSNNSINSIKKKEHERLKKYQELQQELEKM